MPTFGTGDDIHELHTEKSASLPNPKTKCTLSLKWLSLPGSVAWKINIFGCCKGEWFTISASEGHNKIRFESHPLIVTLLMRATYLRRKNKWVL